MARGCSHPVCSSPSSICCSSTPSAELGSSKNQNRGQKCQLPAFFRRNPPLAALSVANRMLLSTAWVLSTAVHASAMAEQQSDHRLICQPVKNSTYCQRSSQSIINPVSISTAHCTLIGVYPAPIRLYGCTCTCA